MAAIPRAPSCPAAASSHGDEAGRLLSALSRGTVALCLLHALRLQQGRHLCQADHRRRAARHRRAQAHSRRRFALLWLCRLLARENGLPGPCPRGVGGRHGGGTGALPRLLRERRLWSKSRSSAFWEIVRAKAFSAWEWGENFRVSPGTFDYLCAHLRNAIQRQDTNMRRAIPADVRLAMTLWRLGACTEYRAVEQLFGVSRSTVCKILRDVCEAVVGILTPLYVRPPDPAEVAAGNGFPLPQLAGVLGSLHVPIRAPNENAAGYYNRRGWHSLVVQATVDSRGCFWDINVGCPGRVTDAQVLCASELYQRAQGGELFPGGSRDVSGVQVPIYVLGGCSFPLLPWLMRPYRAAALSPSQRRFNEYADAARTVLAVAFGRLRGRWRCLTKRNDTDISFLPTLIAACCTLHNICENRGDAFQACWMEEEQEEREEEEAEPREEQPSEEGEEEDAEAVEIRDALAWALRG